MIAWIALCTSAHLRAQPVITATDHTPLPGETFYYHACGSTNILWDFTAVVCGMNGFSPWVDAATAPGSAQFLGATLALHVTGSPLAVFYTATASDISFNGTFALPSELELCGDPIKQFEFPFTYGSTFTDTFSCAATGGALDRTRFGTITVTGEDYGTLVIPGATFPDCRI